MLQPDQPRAASRPSLATRVVETCASAPISIVEFCCSMTHRPLMLQSPPGSDQPGQALPWEQTNRAELPPEFGRDVGHAPTPAANPHRARQWWPALKRWGAVLAIAGAAWVGGVAPGQPLPAAWALSEDEVARRLGAVPVFTIMLASGQPLVVFPSDGQGTANRPLSEGRVIHFFNPNDAQAMLTSLQRRNPEGMAGSSILVSSLGEVYQRQRSPGQANRPRTSYWPLAAQNDAAINLIRAENPGELGNDVIFPGIPLFTATQGNTDNFLTIQEDNREVVPLFFRREDLDALLSRFRQVQPALINNAQIQVINLETLITELEQGREGDPFVDRARLIPSREALEFIQSVQGEQQGQAPQPSGQR